VRACVSCGFQFDISWNPSCVTVVSLLAPPFGFRHPRPQACSHPLSPPAKAAETAAFTERLEQQLSRGEVNVPTGFSKEVYVAYALEKHLAAKGASHNELLMWIPTMHGIHACNIPESAYANACFLLLARSSPAPPCPLSPSALSLPAGWVEYHPEHTRLTREEVKEAEDAARKALGDDASLLRQGETLEELTAFWIRDKNVKKLALCECSWESFRESILRDPRSAGIRVKGWHTSGSMPPPRPPAPSDTCKHPHARLDHSIAPPPTTLAAAAAVAKVAEEAARAKLQAAQLSKASGSRPSPGKSGILFCGFLDRV
jgi:hypothetical protein